jgi:hypothetical protein
MQPASVEQMARALRIANGTAEHLALEVAELQGRLDAAEREREEALIDREVFRAWVYEWAPELLGTLIQKQREIDNLTLRLRLAVQGRESARRDVEALGAERRAQMVAA